MSQLNGINKDSSVENLNQTNAVINNDQGFQSQKLNNNNLDMMSASLNAAPISTAIPQYGFKVKFNHIFPEKRTQILRPSLRQSIPLIPLAWR